jgi:hypothetical protein
MRYGPKSSNVIDSNGKSRDHHNITTKVTEKGKIEF